MKAQSTVAALAVVALLAAGCGRSGSSSSSGSDSGGGGKTQAVSGDFGSLKNVCHSGKATSSPAQGVTAAQIKVGVFTDQGFTKSPDASLAAKVFTSWCNAAGGINGRKIVANMRDTNLTAVAQQMLTSCREDFVLAGGFAALDGLGVQQRLQCMLPAFPAQTSMTNNRGSDLQVEVALGGWTYNPYNGYFTWLTKEKYPDSAKAVGIITGDAPVTKPIAGEAVEVVKSLGGGVVYNDLYPPTGVSDWTPYAQSIKSKGVKGLIFEGDFASLAKLEQVLTTIDYKLDWIDANSNAYNPAFISLAGKSLSAQHNYADISGTYPLEKASGSPAMQQLTSLFSKYANGAPVTLPILRSFSSWLLFASAAENCGDNLTRKCVYDAARTQSSWTAGGLQAPLDLTQPDAPITCFNVEQATPNGWQPADFAPNNGPYRCGNDVAHKLQGNFGSPLTLAAVGKNINELK